MANLWNSYIQTISFFEAGGTILSCIGVTTFILWIFLIDRYIFIAKTFPSKSSAYSQKWNSRNEKTSWAALRIRESILSDAKLELTRYLGLIKTIVAICPLLGLMGTVTGMINVFDVMGMTGNSNTRLMAAGISLATIPTMAGMVTALSGIYFGSVLDSKANKAKDNFAETLEIG